MCDAIKELKQKTVKVLKQEQGQENLWLPQIFCYRLHHNYTLDRTQIQTLLPYLVHVEQDTNTNSTQQ